MDDDLLSWKIFTTLYRTRYIHRASKELNLDEPYVSRKITALEKRLGRCLFNRKSRPFEITDEAHTIYEYAEKMIQEREKIQRFLEEKYGDDSQVIRVMIGNSFRKFTPKLLMEYLSSNPTLRFNMISPIDLNEYLEGKADVIALSGPVTLSNQLSFFRGKMIFVPVASPEYIKRHGKIEKPEHLVGHQVFHNLYHDRYSFSVKFPLVKNGQYETFTALESVRWSNVEMSLQAALDGAGVALSVPLFLCIDELEQGKLLPILNGWHRPSQNNYIVCRKDDWKIRRIRLFVTWFSHQLALYELNCERRFIHMFGKSFYKELSQ